MSCQIMCVTVGLTDLGGGKMLKILSSSHYYCFCRQLAHLKQPKSPIFWLNTYRREKKKYSLHVALLYFEIFWSVTPTFTEDILEDSVLIHIDQGKRKPRRKWLCCLMSQRPTNLPDISHSFPQSASKSEKNSYRRY